MFDHANKGIFPFIIVMPLMLIVLFSFRSLTMEDVEYRCFVGGLSWSTKDDDLRDAFEKFGRLTEAKVTSNCYHMWTRVHIIKEICFLGSIDSMHGHLTEAVHGAMSYCFP